MTKLYRIIDPVTKKYLSAFQLESWNGSAHIHFDEIGSAIHNSPSKLVEIMARLDEAKAKYKTLSDLYGSTNDAYGKVIGEQFPVIRNHTDSGVERKLVGIQEVIEILSRLTVEAVRIEVIDDAALTDGIFKDAMRERAFRCLATNISLRTGGVHSSKDHLGRKIADFWYSSKDDKKWYGYIKFTFDGVFEDQITELGLTPNDYDRISKGCYVFDKSTFNLVLITMDDDVLSKILTDDIENMWYNITKDDEIE